MPKQLRRPALCSALGVLLSAMGQPSVLAQTPEDESLFLRDRNISVEERPRPEFAPLGVRLGSMMFKPELETSLDHSDNIFATNNDKVSDFLTQLTAKMSAESTWSRHFLELNGSLTRRRHFDSSSENATDFSLRVNGGIDVYHGLKLDLGVSHEDLTEPRAAAVTEARSIEPIDFNFFDVNLNAEWEVSRTRLTSRIVSEKTNYKTGRLPNGGILSQDYRDNDARFFLVKAEYAASPDTAAFVRVRHRYRDYKEILDQTRDQKGLTIDAGANFDISNLVRGEIGIGYLNHDFDDTVTKDVSGFSLDTRIEWFPTPLTTVTVEAERDIQPSAIATSPAFISLGGGVRVDYDFRRNMIFSAGANYYDEDYQGIARTDKRAEQFIRGTYLLNRTLGLKVDYTRTQLDSSGQNAGPNFDVNRISLGLIIRR